VLGRKISRGMWTSHAATKSCTCALFPLVGRLKCSAILERRRQCSSKPVYPAICASLLPLHPLHPLGRGVMRLNLGDCTPEAQSATKHREWLPACCSWLSGGGRSRFTCPEEGRMDMASAGTEYRLQTLPPAGLRIAAATGGGQLCRYLGRERYLGTLVRRHLCVHQLFSREPCRSNKVGQGIAPWPVRHSSEDLLPKPGTYRNMGSIPPSHLASAHHKPQPDSHAARQSAPVSSGRFRSNFVGCQP
jgi:hypothetical protein